MRDLQALFSVLDSLSSLFDRLIEVETEKLGAIAINDIAKLDEFMKTEQAISLELKGLDSKREAVQAELGFSGLPMGEIIEKTEGEDAQKLNNIYLSLQEKVEDLNGAIECTKKFIALHLQSLDLLEMRMKTQHEEESGSYEKTGRKKPEDDAGPRFTSRKV